MHKCFCASVLVLLCLLSSIQVIFAANYVPTEKTLLDCGATSDQPDSGGRVWTSDKGSSFLSSSGKSSTATASTQDPADIIDPSRARPASGSGHSKSRTAIIAGGVSGGVVLAVVIGFCVLAASRRHRQGKEASSSDGPSGWLPFSLHGNSHSAGSDDEEVPSNVAYKGKAPDASPGYDGIVTDSRSSGISMSIGGRSLASEDSDGLTPSAVSQTMFSRRS
ncbi:kinase family protein [Populus alba x Populus x berolinensis]|nr:kinase family protein [Populus alba x Populus x berolinensis]